LIEKTSISDFESAADYFCGQNTLWAVSRDILRSQKSRGPLKIFREMAHKIICPKN
jgi:hypothetical protein